MAEVTYPCYIERKDESGFWYWIYYGKNGEELARSSESYVAHADCTHCISLIKQSKNHQTFFYK